MNEVADNPRATIGGNNPPSEFELIRDEINDLYDEAKNFADGEPISDQATHDAIDKLHAALHEAGKRADALRVEEKRPLDEQIDAIQARFNPLIQPKKGRVALAKETLSTLMLPWRQKVENERLALAAAARAEAERLAAIAREAIATSAGDLAAREAAELKVKEAAAVGRFARQAVKGPTGMRSMWRAALVDESAALDWAYGRDPGAFRALVQGQADTVVRAGMRSVPGFRVFEEKVAI